MNDIVSATANLPSLNALGSALGTAIETGESVSSLPYIKMGKDGIWTYGAAHDEVHDDSLWVPNLATIRHGFICWKAEQRDANGKVIKAPAERLGEEMFLISDTPKLPPVSSLPQLEGSWATQWAIEMRCVEGPDEGTDVVYSVSSKGGLQRMRDELLGDVRKRAARGEAPVPLFAFAADSYIHTTYGKTYNPVFEVVDWLALDAEELHRPATAEPEPEPEPAPAPTRRRAAAKVEAPVEDAEFEDAPAAEEPVTEAPTRRRRASPATEAAAPAEEPVTEAPTRRRRRAPAAA
jgi:hypothetical protein